MKSKTDIYLFHPFTHTHIPVSHSEFSRIMASLCERLLAFPLGFPREQTNLSLKGGKWSCVCVGKVFVLCFSAWRGSGRRPLRARLRGWRWQPFSPSSISPRGSTPLRRATTSPSTAGPRSPSPRPSCSTITTDTPSQVTFRLLQPVAQNIGYWKQLFIWFIHSFIYRPPGSYMTCLKNGIKQYFGYCHFGVN
jgi:hypothetical protein